MTALATHRPVGLDVRDRILALTNATTDELRSELANALSLTADHLRYLGAIWGELTRRGEDLSELRAGMGFYLEKIAAGQLLAETVVKYAGQPGVLRRVGMLPIERQRLVVETGKLPWDPTRPKRKPSCKQPRPRIHSGEGDDETTPPPAGPKSDLQSPLDEALFELNRVRHAYGHIPELARVFQSLDDVVKAKALFRSTERWMRGGGR